jgi:predicted nucleotidyltransferase component of viral defense system
LELLNSFCTHPKLTDFFLVGGTALALQLGHRISIDLDFFSVKPLKTNELIGILEKEYNAEIFQLTDNAIVGKVKDVKIDFIAHQYPLLNELKIENDIRLSSLEDIAAMKLNAIKNRGSKKDFVDLYFLLKQFSLTEMLSLVNKKYANNVDVLTLKSLVYFDDAELQPDCEMRIAVTWDEVKKEIERRTLEIL